VNRSQQAKVDSLYRQHVNALKRQGKADKTIDAYARAVRRLSEFFDANPADITQPQLETYFDSLIRTHSWATIKCDRNGLQFFYKYVLKRPWTWVDIVKPPQVRALPDVLSLKEIERLINGTRELRYQSLILVAFGMGLRLGEVLNLQIPDIDSTRMKVHVRRAKGQKDRLVTLPKQCLNAMRRYWKTHRHPRLIFPNGRTPEERQLATTRMSRGGIQQSLKAIAKSCGIHKHLTPHTLRHSYGTLMLEAGVSLRAIQDQMGHQSPKTTALYTQLTEATQQDTAACLNSMLDSLKLFWGA
jgi:integrase/recombinase XerD